MVHRGKKIKILYDIINKGYYEDQAIRNYKYIDSFQFVDILKKYSKH